MDKAQALKTISEKENSLIEFISNINSDQSQDKEEAWIWDSETNKHEYLTIKYELLSFVAKCLWNPEVEIINLFNEKGDTYKENHLIEYKDLSEFLRSDMNIICLVLYLDAEKNFQLVPNKIKDKSILNLIRGINEYGYSRIDELEENEILKHKILSPYFNPDLPHDDGDKNSHGVWVETSIYAILWEVFVYKNTFQEHETKKYVLVLLDELESSPNSLKENIFRTIDDTSLDDEDFILSVLKHYNNYGIPIQFASERLRKDKKFALKVCAIDGSILLDFDELFLKDKDVVVIALNKNPELYSYIDSQLQQDDEVFNLVIHHPNLSEYDLEKFKKIKSI